MFKNRCKPKPRKTTKPGKPKRRAQGEDENAEPETEAQEQLSEEEKDTAPSENSEEPQAEPDEQETSKTDEDSEEETPSDDANPSSEDEADSGEDTPAESEQETEPEQDVTAEIAKLQTDLENAQKALADKEAELASLQAVEQTGKVLSSEGLPRELAQYLPSDPERLAEAVELLKSLQARPGGERIPRPDSVKGERGGKDYEAFFASLD
ncbi:hypothetical protein [Varibaculum prostatecancerukia]|uniref:hypothetical protein n=1 Tax=Varibaculum prostatecancerukia TaxID=2811781 RepID=UPI001C00313E|nr:hypothetical protein [Varibaculum prostatecancerukia]